MAKPRFTLGRGLDALIPGSGELGDATSASAAPSATPLEVSVSSIIPNPYQPRALFPEDAAFQDLVHSIREHGVIQPLVVSEMAGEERQGFQEGDEGPRYKLIAGERRWRAAQMAALKTVPVVVREATPQQMLELALIENIQREDLNPIEEALAYQTLSEEYGLTHEAVGKRVGKSREAITNAIRLLNLPVSAREKLANRSPEFTPGHARAVLRIQQEESQQHAIQQIIAQSLTVREAEDLARRLAETSLRLVPEAPTRAPQPQVDATQMLEGDFRKALMMKVQLRRNANGHGFLTIFFANEEELHQLYEILVARQDADSRATSG